MLRSVSIYLLAAFVLGIFIGGLGVALYSAKVYTDLSQMVMFRELMRSGEEAIAAYHGENLEVAIWALSNHLDLLQERLTEGLPRDMISEDQWLICARLGKLWRRAGNEAKASSYLERALSLLERDGPSYEFLKTPESLIEFVEMHDSRHGPKRKIKGKEAEKGSGLLDERSTERTGALSRF